MLKDSKTICLTAVTLKEQTDERKEWNFFFKKKWGHKKERQESTQVGGVEKTGVQLLTPLQTRLQKNRTARNGLNWSAHVHLHWWDNWADWPLKCLWNWPAPQQGNVTSSLPLHLALTEFHIAVPRMFNNWLMPAAWQPSPDTTSTNILFGSFNLDHFFCLLKCTLSFSF